MKLEEVLPALRAGKTVRLLWEGRLHQFSSFSELVDWLGLDCADAMQSSNWSIVEEPATDEELAAAFEARAEKMVSWGHPDTAETLRQVAEMVRTGRVDPSWKVGK